MTGPPGQPLRAGASVIDVTGGMFGAIAILGALHQRNASGKGQKVIASLYESTVFLVGQHRSEEHTSELQSLRHLVCRLLLEKKKRKKRKRKKKKKNKKKKKKRRHNL